ncbi:MAG: DNA polymerase III subunit chi [Thermodesulfobacteriota bacterium]
MRAEFINLRQAGLAPERAAALIAARHHAQGRRVLVLAADPAQAAQVDRLLWTLDPASFVPHAIAGGPDQDQEPVLIAHAEGGAAGNPNAATVLVLMQPPQNLPAGGWAELALLLPAEEGPELARCREHYRVLQQKPGVELVHTTRLG